jgi:hypothetical protein
MATTKFTINIWKFVGMEAINNALDEDMEKKKKGHIATDIKYDCLKIEKNGDLTLKANYVPEGINGH